MPYRETTSPTCRRRVEPVLRARILELKASGDSILKISRNKRGSLPL